MVFNFSTMFMGYKIIMKLCWLPSCHHTQTNNNRPRSKNPLLFQPRKFLEKKATLYMAMLHPVSIWEGNIIAVQWAKQEFTYFSDTGKKSICLTALSDSASCACNIIFVATLDSKKDTFDTSSFICNFVVSGNGFLERLTNNFGSKSTFS